jgi:hypothetical protein
MPLKETHQFPKAPFDLDSSGNSTPTYQEVMDFWNAACKTSKFASIHEFGESDFGLPLHYIWLSHEQIVKKKPEQIRKKPILLINNAIHPGEPDGVDASMQLAYQLLNDSLQYLLDQVDIAIIPMYNIGGAHNRSAHSRANQNGPTEYGFRGNAQNLDLNRDFAKCDSKNALSFAHLIDKLDPDFYVETHVSNGADYQYTMTYLSTQKDKIAQPLGDKLRSIWTPYLNQAMAYSTFPMIPYVNVHGVPPDHGYDGFYDSPRYSSGYLTLLHIPGYITETHMLKPYAQRVHATYHFLRNTAHLLFEQGISIMDARNASKESNLRATTQAIDWELDSSRVDSLTFKGYESKLIKSAFSGGNRRFYDRSQPRDFIIPYYGYFKSNKEVSYPKAYYLKRGFVEVEKRLINQGIELRALEKDTNMMVEVYHIDTFSTIPQPYEGHYLHYGTKIKKSSEFVQLQKGDWLIEMNNSKRRLILELLEPEAPDSYFNWNYFDAILQQKEWYSEYVFEDIAANLLKTDAQLKQGYDSMQQANTDFENNPQWQLYWIYQHSAYYEKEHMRYPVFREM